MSSGTFASYLAPPTGTLNPGFCTPDRNAVQEVINLCGKAAAGKIRSRTYKRVQCPRSLSRRWLSFRHQQRRLPKDQKALSCRTALIGGKSSARRLPLKILPTVSSKLRPSRKFAPTLSWALRISKLVVLAAEPDSQTKQSREGAPLVNFTGSQKCDPPTSGHFRALPGPLGEDGDPLEQTVLPVNLTSDIPAHAEFAHSVSPFVVRQIRPAATKFEKSTH